MDDNANTPIEVQDSRDFWWACVDIAVLRDPRLTVYSKAVYAILCTFADVHGRECFPSIRAIAEAASISERTAQRALGQLAELGYIERRKRFKDNIQISSLYKIVGHNAPETQSAAASLRLSDTPGVSEGHTELEPENLKSKDTQATLVEPEAPNAEGENAEERSAEKDDDTLDISEVPPVLKETVELFLMKTGRKHLARSELAPLLMLSKWHYPARIQKEISTSVERFQRQGRPLSELNITYICQALAQQRSYKPQKKPRASPAAQVGMYDDFEAANEAELMARYGGGKHAGDV